MSEFFGDGVSRNLSAKARQFVNIVWQRGKPPLDAEFNLLTQLTEEARQTIVSANVSSGWISNAYDPRADFEFDRQASNMFWLGKDRANSEGDIVWANVNGWLIPVVGTQSNDTKNSIMLPPPSGTPSESDVNFVFLEVWKSQVSPDGAVNKPSESQLYKYGNVEYGGTNLDNDLLDPAILFETTERVQLQYRLRVVPGVNPALYPHGFSPGVKAQGTLDNPTTSANPAYQFTNMKEELGDPGLWRAGDGDGESGLVGTVDGYVYAVPLCMVFRRTTLSWTKTQQHGAFDRNPDMTDRSEAKVLPTVKITADMSATDTVISVDTTQSATTLDSGGGLLRVDGEIMEYSDYTATTITISERGARDSHATSHDVSASVDFVSGHPLGLFSDQITPDDVLDIRHVISMDGLDYDGLLRKNFDDLIKGEMATSWKRSSANVKGRKHFQIDYFGAGSVAPDYTIKADAPDGKRKVFSDASTLQPNNLMVLGTSGSSEDSSDLTLNPNATIHRYDSSSAENWGQNDVVLLDLDQYRATFPLSAPNNRKVRFVHPFEYDGSSHSPVRIWFGDTDPADGAAGKDAPLTLESTDADPWFMVLGSKVDGLSVSSEGQNDLTFVPGTPDVVQISGTTFTAADETALLNAGAWILITAGSTATSTHPENHGAFRITGVDGSGNLEVVAADGGTTGFSANTDNRTWSLRLTECHENDEDMAIVLTNATATAVESSLNVSYDLLYHPARGLSRVPDEALHVELNPGVGANYLRENDYQNVADSPAATVKKSPVVSLTAYPHKQNKELQVRDPQDVAKGPESVWAEAYVDRGSKTVLYQPVRNVSARLDLQSNPSAISYTDPTGEFNLVPGDSDASVVVPKELRPSLGRIDIPFVKSKASVPATSTEPAYGLNCTFLSGSPDLNTANFLSQKMVAVYDPVNMTDTDFGSYLDLAGVGSGPGDQSALVCRYYNKGGVRGIELPAHFGVARLFAAHTQDDYYNISPGSSIFSGPQHRVASGVDRPNILRTDAERRSLIITDDNTFVIPEDALDQNYSSDDLEGQPLVFEFAAFLFDDWKADLMRIHKRTITPTALSNSFQMFVNGPAETGDEFFLINTRVPYQGSIYGTMPTATTDTSSVDYVDYTPKRNTESQANVLDLLTSFDVEEDVRVSNPGTLEILAALPFATTLGTGVVSGPVVPGSYTDIGYLDLSGYPFEALTDDDRKVLSRAHPYTQSGETVAPSLSETLGGVTERLPLGLMVSDYQFIGEGVQGDYKRFWTPDVSMETLGDYHSDRRLSKTTLSGAMVFSDGTSGLQYEHTHELYRTLRGGTVMTASGSKPGGAVVMSGGRTYKDLPYLNNPDAKNLKMHGAVLFGVAFLVRNKSEVVTDDDLKASFGDEVQMLVLTGMTLGEELDLTGDYTKEFVDLLIQMHPMGAGEGYCAADRYRIEGRPLQKRMRNVKGDVEALRGRDPSGPIAPPTDDHC